MSIFSDISKKGQNIPRYLCRGFWNKTFLILRPSFVCLGPGDGIIPVFLVPLLAWTMTRQVWEYPAKNRK